MIAAFALAAIVYTDVPSNVVRATVYQWRPGSPPVPIDAVQTNEGSRVRVTVAEGIAAVLVFERRDGAYLLDGPFVASRGDAERRLDGIWRRTLQGGVIGHMGTPPSIEWLPAHETIPGPWPACWWTGSEQWACIGLPIEAAGVVFCIDGRRIWSAPIHTPSAAWLTPGSWGRLIVVRDRGEGAPPGLKATVARPVTPTRRPNSVRLDTAALSDVRIVPVDASSIWIGGDSSPLSAWVEVKTTRSGPSYLRFADLAEGSPQISVHVLLEETRSLDALVVSDRAEPVAAALVTLFRVIDPAPAAGARTPPPRRVFAQEAVADAGGRLRIEGLGDADYEIVAWHPRLGRGSLLLPASADRVTIQIHSPGIVRGRVLAGGTPAPGVEVTVIPDPTAFATAEDPIDLKGGDARTGADGRFVVTLAPGGGGELRVGGGMYATRRIPLPRATLPIVELGDLELGDGIKVSIALDQDPGCDVRAAGPIGRAGVRIVTASRAGPGLFTMTLPEEGSWEFTLLCGRNERALAPAVVRISNQTPPGLVFGVR